MTSKILGVAAVVFVRFVCGLDWIPSLFLYFPFHALARSIAENDEVLAAFRPSVNVAQLEQLKRWELSRSPASAAGARVGMEI